jgi:hypothetical protein
MTKTLTAVRVELDKSNGNESGCNWAVVATHSTMGLVRLNYATKAEADAVFNNITTTGRP